MATPKRALRRLATPVLAEPPPVYLARPPLVVDCSVLSAFLFAEPTRDEALRHLLGRSLHAPTLLDHEIANVAVKKKRQGWPGASIDMALAHYAEHDIELHRVDTAGQVALAFWHGFRFDMAALLLLNRPGGSFRGLRQVLVYPGAFVVDRDRVDAAGLVHGGRRALSGES